MQAERPCVHAVVVTFHPSRDQVQDLLHRLLPDVAHIWVVDNTPGSAGANFLPKAERVHVSLLPQQANQGLATGLNIGIRSALSAGATHVLMSDQDSLPKTGMVGRLVEVMEALQREHVQVAAVGPQFVDVATDARHPFQVAMPGRCFYRLAHPGGDDVAIETLTLITSGTLAKSEALLDVGLMRDDFFIDHVDIEWCHRARGRGWRLFGTARAQMRQRLGESTFRAWRLGWRQENAYQPVRIYYRVRNFLALCKTRDIPVCWKMRNGLYWVWFVASHGIFGHARMASLRMAMAGLRDGLAGRMGAIRPGTGSG